MSDAAVEERADVNARNNASRLRDSTFKARTRLAHFLIAKSIAEVLFVVTLAVVYQYITFNPYFRGSVDVADARRVSGWVVDEAQPSAHVEIQLYIDGRFIASGWANLSRPDVLAAGRAIDEWHGFSFTTPPLQSGEHEARVYAVHESRGGMRRTLQLIAKPMRFKVEVNEDSATSNNTVQEKENH